MTSIFDEDQDLESNEVSKVLGNATRVTKSIRKEAGFSEFFALEEDEMKDIEDLTLTRIEDQKSLELKSDLYSLGFYGFFLNDTESMLSLIENKEEVTQRRSKNFKDEHLE